MVNSHARVRPSGLALTIACNASLQLQEAVVPLPPTDEILEGNAAHWVARRYLAGYAHELPEGATFHFEGREWKVDIDMRAGAQLYVNALGGVDPEMHIEETLRIPRVHVIHCSGTPDGWRYYFDARLAYPHGPPEGLPADKFHAGRLKLLRVGDYKFGHRYVEVFENPQLAAYASGVYELLGLNEDDQDTYVELVLVQPRSFHPDGPVRVWRTPGPSLNTIIIKAGNAARRALLSLHDATYAPEAQTGPHCIDCTARHACRALQLNTRRLVDFAHAPEFVELPPQAIGQELAIVDDALKQLEARRTGLAAQAEIFVRDGKAVPFYGMKPGRSILTYHENVNADELVSLGDLLNIDLRRKLERKDLVVTPSQAIQLGIDEQVMSNYAARPKGAMKLTRDDPITARKVFSK